IGGSEEIPAVQIAISKEFEEISMKRVRAGLCDRVYRSARVPAAGSILRARDQPKLLKSIRKRQGQIRASIHFNVVSAVQIVLNAITGPARDGDIHTRVHHVGWRGARLHGRSA